MPANPVPPPQVQRFRESMERLVGPEVDRFGAAVSGGPDSLALLLLAHAAFPGRLEAVTVDHGLRSASASEARAVARICDAYEIPHATLQVEVQQGGDGLQGEARQARYRALSGWAAERSIPAICTGHHADDQAETFLMRLQRGSGIAGLSGVRKLRREGALRIVRPLLDWKRGELQTLVEVSGHAAVDDPSNRDGRFDRVHMRGFLAANPQFDPVRLARSAGSLAEANQALEWAADLLEAERCAVSGSEWRIDASGLPRELARRLLARSVAGLRLQNSLAGSVEGGRDVEGLLQTLERGGKGTLAGVVGEASGAAWRLSIAPPRRGE